MKQNHTHSQFSFHTLLPLQLFDASFHQLTTLPSVKANPLGRKLIHRNVDMLRLQTTKSLTQSLTLTQQLFKTSNTLSKKAVHIRSTGILISPLSKHRKKMNLKNISCSLTIRKYMYNTNTIRCALSQHTALHKPTYALQRSEIMTPILIKSLYSVRTYEQARNKTANIPKCGAHKRLIIKSHDSLTNLLSVEKLVTPKNTTAPKL